MLDEPTKSQPDWKSVETETDLLRENSACVSSDFWDAENATLKRDRLIKEPSVDRMCLIGVWLVKMAAVEDERRRKSYQNGRVENDGMEYEGQNDVSVNDGWKLFYPCFVTKLTTLRSLQSQYIIFLQSKIDQL